MPNLLPMEDEWRHLIEKRSGQDRRKVSAALGGSKKAAPTKKPRAKDRRKGGSQGK